jgi:hypothetical protein
MVKTLEGTEALPAEIDADQESAKTTFAAVKNILDSYVGEPNLTPDQMAARRALHTDILTTMIQIAQGYGLERPDGFTGEPQDNGTVIALRHADGTPVKGF